MPAVRALLALPVVATVGMSMASLYLDYHWLTDLLAGVGFGVVLLALVLVWDLRRPWSDHQAPGPAGTGRGGRPGTRAHATARLTAARPVRALRR